MTMRILFIGDIVGRPGVAFVKRAVPALVRAERLDLVIANAENASNAGSGLTPQIYRGPRASGTVSLTRGAHIYKRAEVISTLGREDRVCKPANFPAAAPGREAVVVTARDGTQVGVFCVLGRTYMRSVDC